MLYLWSNNIRNYVQHFLPIVFLFLHALLLNVVGLLCTVSLSCVYCCLTTLVAGLLARSQYLEGPATGHLSTGFSWFPCVYEQMVRWFPRLQVATACFSCSPPNLNFLGPYFILMYKHNNHCHQVTAHLQLIYYYCCYYYYINRYLQAKAKTQPLKEDQYKDKF